MSIIDDRRDLSQYGHIERYYKVSEPDCNTIIQYHSVLLRTNSNKFRVIHYREDKVYKQNSDYVSFVKAYLDYLAP